MTTLHIDLESKSTIDLRKTGVYRYAAHPSTDIWCAAWAVDDAPVRVWTKDGDSRDLFHAIRNVETYTAHNSQFERVMCRGVLTPRYGWPVPPLQQWRCTMVMALAMSLPASLKNATRAVGIDDGGKEDSGHALMLQMCKPRRFRKDEDPKGIYWFDDEARLQRLCAVCSKDVEDERELEKRLLQLRPAELRLWQLDQQINDRGVYVDTALCDAAIQIVDQATLWLDDELWEITNGQVAATTAVAQISAWLREQGHPTDSLDKDHIDDMLLQPGLTVPVRRVLEIRREGATAAVKKIRALLNGKDEDDRARGLLQFHAAGTGRWAGRRFQPQNLRRPQLEDVDAAISMVGHGSAEAVSLVYGEPLDVVADCLRGMVTAAPGNKLLAADFSNIEGRLIAWLADEEWKLQAFRDFDAGIGHDIYKLAYARSFGVEPETVTKQLRQVGKVQELALGFQGGVGALLKMAAIYGVKVSEADAADWRDAWRDAHPNVKQYWRDLENSAKSAIENPGEVFYAGRIAFRVAGSFLFMRLPSGRSIAYPYPCIKPKLMPWTDDGAPVWRDSVSYKGTDTYTRKWTDCFAHGGLLFNNAVQGTARDIEAEGMTRVEAAGYAIVLTVHDEVVCEVPEAFGSVAEFESLMVALPEWAAGLPVAAEAWSGPRYKKG